MITFQEILSRLTNFWAKSGCAVHQGHDLEVGAGTFNPATFLRCLGPEPYSAVYIEPSRRPQDARYGENPNRIHCFHQMQVIIKPSPLNIQEIFLESLKVIGIDLSKHDIRFVHDDWESPTLGAWGLGWEVWLDGMEVTQFTYFQSVASKSLSPISVELTYGLERLAMYIQDVKSMFDIKWNETLNYGEIFHRNEVEWSHYNFTKATTKMWFQHFEDFENEAKMLLQENLPIPAYDFVMKASHAFNILEARGMLSVTERTGYIARIRDLARQTAQGYLATREEMGFPLEKESTADVKVKQDPITGTFNSDSSRDLLIEIGSEELPATFVMPAIKSFEKLVLACLKEHHLSFESHQTFATPRRLSILVKKLQEKAPDQKVERKGPPIQSAFDEKGNPTKQGEGFLKSLGLSQANLQDIESSKFPELSIREVKSVKYLWVELEKPGHATLEILSKQLPKIITSISFKKKMRWSNLNVEYARPLKWYVALFGKAVIPFDLANIQSGNTTYGHSQLCAKEIPLSDPNDYVDALREHKVLVDIQERKECIEKQLSSLEKEHHIQPLQKERVLAEVVFLSEKPMLTLGSFDKKFLSVPKEVLISEMIAHQRYFPVEKQGDLLNEFIITCDNTPSKLIVSGNEKVLSARLADGTFLYEEDIKKPLESYVEKLKSMTFQKDLGSVYDKSMRLVKHAKVLSSIYGIKNHDDVLRAAYLCKADLSTLLTYEFPELQGTIGKYYAKLSKETDAVALAIEEHYLPRFESDHLPSTQEGIIVSLAERLDNLIGYFSIGIRPSSSSDPYALRRQTLGILKMLVETKVNWDLKDAFKTLYEHFENQNKDTSFIQDLEGFTLSRLKTVFEDYGFKKDEIEACLHLHTLNPYDQYLRLVALQKFRKTQEFDRLYEVFKRAKGQLQGNSYKQLSNNLLKEPAEKELFQHFTESKSSLDQALSQKHYEDVIKLLASFQNPLSKLFDEVKILADEKTVRENRLALLQNVFELFETLLDFSKIQEHKA